MKMAHYMTTAVLAFLMSVDVYAAGRDKIQWRAESLDGGYQEKSTLETFKLRSLDSDALSGAAVDGALDVSLEDDLDKAPVVLSAHSNRSDERLLREESLEAPRPVTPIAAPRLPGLNNLQVIDHTVSHTAR